MRHRILLVEDDDELREALRAVLGVQGFDVACARDGVEALRLLWQGFRPCVILLDLMLPRLDGYTFGDYLRANAAWAGIPVIVVSALDERSRHELAPTAWFTKPLDIDALTSAVAHYC
jgi:DNA-binding response OmpR family regulator